MGIRVSQRSMVPMKRCNLHTHTHFSHDGSFSPREVVKYFHGEGIRTISITDHDSVSGLRQGKEEALSLGMEFLSGIEMSTIFLNREERTRIVHILGYGFDIDAIEGDRDFSILFNNIREVETSFFKRLCEATEEEPIMLKKSGRQWIKIKLDFNELKALKGEGELSGEHLTLLLMKKIASSFKRVYFSRRTIIGAFINHKERALREFVRQNPGMQVHIPGSYKKICLEQAKRRFRPLPYTADAIEMLKRVGGVPVIAHPADQYKGVALEELEHCISLGILGIEVFHQSTFLEHTEALLSIARRENLIITGGSDFHKPGQNADKEPKFTGDDIFISSPDEIMSARPL